MEALSSIAFQKRAPHLPKSRRGVGPSATPTVACLSREESLWPGLHLASVGASVAGCGEVGRADGGGGVVTSNDLKVEHVFIRVVFGLWLFSDSMAGEFSPCRSRCLGHAPALCAHELWRRRRPFGRISCS